MGNTFTLDSLREEVEKEFAPVKIALSDGSEVTLRNLLRLRKADRQVVLEALKDLDNLSEEGTSIDEVELLVETVEDVLKKVSGKDGDKLVKELDGDVSLIMKVLEHWMGSSQAGEAQPSPAS